MSNKQADYKKQKNYVYFSGDIISIAITFDLWYILNHKNAEIRLWQ